MMSLNLLCVLSLSLVVPADGWHLPCEATRVIAQKPSCSRVKLSFVPATNNEDLLRVLHRDERDEPAIVHKDPDPAETYYQEAHAEFEVMLVHVKNKNPLVEVFTLDYQARTKRTPREDHFLFTRLIHGGRRFQR